MDLGDCHTCRSLSRSHVRPLTGSRRTRRFSMAYCRKNVIRSDNSDGDEDEQTEEGDDTEEVTDQDFFEFYLCPWLHVTSVE